MKKNIFIVVVSMFCLCLPHAHSQDIFAGYEQLFTAPLHYTTHQASEKISIDGKLTEKSWEAAPWSEYFTDIEGDKKPAPTFKTRFKLLWDTQYVYIAAEMEEPDIWAYLHKHDDIVFLDNDFEIFIDPDGDSHNYFEIEINAVNNIFDLFMAKPYRNGGPAVTTWDVQNLQSAVSINGTINNAKDKDKKWIAEMAIPFRSLHIGGKQSKNPMDWRINFSRVEWETEVKDGRYVKSTDSVTHRPKAEHNWVWSPQGVVNMHFPERWGYLHFSEEKSANAPAAQPVADAEPARKYLWLLYYKQQDYRREHHQFATMLSQINFPANVDVTDLNCSFTLDATGSQFKATATSATNEKWQIDHEGKINKL